MWLGRKGRQGVRRGEAGGGRATEELRVSEVGGGAQGAGSGGRQAGWERCRSGTEGSVNQQNVADGPSARLLQGRHTAG